MTWEQFINLHFSYAHPLPITWLISHSTQSFMAWSEAQDCAFSWQCLSTGCCIKEALVRIAAFHSFFQIGWPCLQPFTGCGKLEINRLPFTPLPRPPPLFALSAPPLSTFFFPRMLLSEWHAPFPPPMLKLHFVFLWNFTADLKRSCYWFIAFHMYVVRWRTPKE